MIIFSFKDDLNSLNFFYFSAVDLFCKMLIRPRGISAVMDKSCYLMDFSCSHFLSISFITKYFLENKSQYSFNDFYNENPYN